MEIQRRTPLKTQDILGFRSASAIKLPSNVMHPTGEGTNCQILGIYGGQGC